MISIRNQYFVGRAGEYNYAGALQMRVKRKCETNKASTREFNAWHPFLRELLTDDKLCRGVMRATREMRT